jgi:hypothetical protein
MSVTKFVNIATGVAFLCAAGFGSTAAAETNSPCSAATPELCAYIDVNGDVDVAAVRAAAAKSGGATLKIWVHDAQAAGKYASLAAE